MIRSPMRSTKAAEGARALAFNGGAESHARP